MRNFLNLVVKGLKYASYLVFIVEVMESVSALIKTHFPDGESVKLLVENKKNED